MLCVNMQGWQNSKALKSDNARQSCDNHVKFGRITGLERFALLLRCSSPNLPVPAYQPPTSTAKEAQPGRVHYTGTIKLNQHRCLVVNAVEADRFGVRPRSSQLAR